MLQLLFFFFLLYNGVLLTDLNIQIFSVSQKHVETFDTVADSRTDAVSRGEDRLFIDGH